MDAAVLGCMICVVFYAGLLSCFFSGGGLGIALRLYGVCCPMLVGVWVLVIFDVWCDRFLHCRLGSLMFSFLLLCVMWFVC